MSDVNCSTGSKDTFSSQCTDSQVMTCVFNYSSSFFSVSRTNGNYKACFQEFRSSKFLYSKKKYLFITRVIEGRIIAFSGCLQFPPFCQTFSPNTATLQKHLSIFHLWGAFIAAAYAINHQEEPAGCVPTVWVCLVKL